MTILELPSPNHGPRPDGASVRFLVLHYTGMQDAATALNRLTDPVSEVSAHYTVDEDGTVYAHVPEDRRAWHAGKSAWAGCRDINSFSIGVEIVNPGHDWGYRPFPPEQMAAVAELCRGITARHRIRPADVLGHSDVAPERKLDPGELFDWAGLAGQGGGLWPEITPADRWDSREPLPVLLQRYGYDAKAEPESVLMAFQRHFQPGRLGQPADGETLAILRALLRLTGR